MARTLGGLLAAPSPTGATDRAVIALSTVLIRGAADILQYFACE